LFSTRPSALLERYQTMRIDTRLAERLKKVSPSLTLAITSKANILKSEGKDIVNFAAGEPDFDTPEPVKTAAIEAIRAGFTKYTPTTGTLELKKLICAKFEKDNSLNYTPEQIVVSCGAKHSIFNAIFALLNRGEEVLIPSPYWVSYPEMVRLAEGVPRLIPAGEDNNFKVTAKELDKYSGPKTKILILNSPSNPTGCVYELAELKEIADLCVKKKIFVISDEIYEKVIYDGLKQVSIATLNSEINALAITVNGLSKSYSMTGWRIGYLGGPVDVVEAISKVQDHTTSNPNSIAQKAAVAALGMPDDTIKAMALEFAKRRDYCVTRISAMPKITCTVPKGAFYIFCDISQTGLDSMAISNRLLEEALVSLIPGKGFGSDNHVRISFATSMQQLEKGMNRLEDWLKKL